MKSPAEIWNRRYADSMIPAQDDHWLERWKSLLPDGPANALDLGCGLGLDTAFLYSLGLRVTSMDFSEEALRLSRQRTPAARHLLHDISDISRFPKGPFAVVVANLSLHYFKKSTTRSIFNCIQQHLIPGGIFAFRVNAIGDIHFGCPETVENWQAFTFGSMTKLFFSSKMIQELLTPGFEILSLEHRETSRFGKPKLMLECIAKKAIE